MPGFLAYIIPVGGDSGGTPPSPWPPNFPTPPIQLPPEVKPPRPPTGIWPGPGDPDYPKPPPGMGPGGPWVPSHPIVIPPGVPPGIWDPTFPTPPIVIPPEPPPDGEEKPEREPVFEKHIGWSPQTGWVVVFVPQVPIVAPSTK